MFNKKIWIVGLSILLSGCIHIYQSDVEQGNIIKEDALKQLKIGMTQDQVIQIMGEPVLQNTFTHNRMNYVYTFQPGKGGNRQTTERRITLQFQKGKLINIENSWKKPTGG